MPSTDHEAIDREPSGELPEPWLAVAEGRMTPEEAFPGEPELWQQLAPLDPDARARLADRVLELCPPAAEPERPPAPVVALPASRRRWWVWAAPLAAAAALLLVLLPSARAPEAVVAGEVRAFSAQRGDPARSELRVPGGEHFFLQCRAPGRALEVVAVRAARSDADDPSPRALGFVAEADPSVQYVLADLPAGAWSVTCGAVDPASRAFVWLEPATRLLVE